MVAAGRSVAIAVKKKLFFRLGPSAAEPAPNSFLPDGCSAAPDLGKSRRNPHSFWTVGRSGACELDESHSNSVGSLLRSFQGKGKIASQNFNVPVSPPLLLSDRGRRLGLLGDPLNRVLSPHGFLFPVTPANPAQQAQAQLLLPPLGHLPRISWQTTRYYELCTHFVFQNHIDDIKTPLPSWSL
jgi:hypothetical protein